MQDIMSQAAELDAAAAHTVAAGMRAVARVDGTHPREEELIDAFEAELPPGQSSVDFGTLTTPAAKEAFIKSCVLVAYADGDLTQAELELLQSYAQGLGMSEAELNRATTEVASALLSQFVGVSVYRDTVVDIGRRLGLDDETISSVLG